jgi:multicomponent Na+:H+ antiporter subunit B
MNNHLLLKTVSVVVIPFIIMFGLYVLAHGKVSPGGGFQSGAIWATAIILHSLVFSVKETKKIISAKALKFIASAGVLIYAATGFYSIFAGGRFLEYNRIAANEHLAQFVGIMTIEVGVHMVVFSVLSLVFWRLVRE